jgi:hypothetical protein
LDKSRVNKGKIILKTENFIRFSGFSLMVGGYMATLGWILFAIFDPVYIDSDGIQWIVFNFLIIFGGVFIAQGLPGFYLSQSHRTGTPGLIALVILFIGIAIPYIAVHSIETATSPDIPPIMRLLVSVGAPGIIIGVLFTGIITYTAGIYPRRWVAAALIILVVLGLITHMFSIPPMFERGIFPAVFTGIVGIIGFYMFFKLKINHTATQ